MNSKSFPDCIKVKNGCGVQLLCSSAHLNQDLVKKIIKIAPINPMYIHSLIMIVPKFINIKLQLR